MSEVSQLEKQLADTKTLVARRDMALKLSKNSDFRKLILEEFCVQEAARYVQASADPALGATERADALAIAQASGHLKRYLSVIVQMGSVAERDLVTLQEAIEEARAAEGDE